MKKRLISVLLTLCMAAGLLPMGAAAEGAAAQAASLPSDSCFCLERDIDPAY